MGWRYRKRIKIAPGVYINLSKSGMSTTIGPRGANVNIGKNGTYLNTGIPGTGLYSRQKIGDSGRKNSVISYSNEKTSNGGCKGCIKLGCGLYLLTCILGGIISIIEGKIKGINLFYSILLLIVFSFIFYFLFIHKARDKKSVKQNKEVKEENKREELKDNNIKPVHIPAKSVEINNDESSNESDNVSKPTNDISTNKSASIDSRLTMVGRDKTIISANSLNVDDINTPINPKEPFINYRYPSLDLLKKYSSNEVCTAEELLVKKKRIIEILNSFNIKIKEITASVGPVITFYEIVLAEDVRISKIRSIENDIALSISNFGARIIAPIPGRGTLGIEVPNDNVDIVSMESILNSKKFQETHMELPLALGKTITNEIFMVDLAKIPHLLLVGAPDQGKSVCLDVIISSLLYRKHPNELKFVLIDPRKVEFSLYIPMANAFMAQVPDIDDEPVVTDANKVMRTLKSICALMDHRYDLLKIAGVRNIAEYNKKFINHQFLLSDEYGNPLHDYMPYIVVMIDDFGDLVLKLGKEFEDIVARIVQFACAVGIHMIIAVQRPSSKIINDNIKMLFPARIAFRVGSVKESYTIIGRPDASRLIGKGDMLYINGNEPIRVQCACLDIPERERIINHIHEQEQAGHTPQYPMQLPEPIVEGDGVTVGPLDISNWDPLFEQIAHAVVSTQLGSTTMIQRQFFIGYNRAGRIMDQLEKAGIVGQAHGSKPRKVLCPDELALDKHIANLRRRNS